MRFASVFRFSARLCSAVLACALVSVAACGFSDEDPLATLSPDELLELCQGYRTWGSEQCRVTSGALRQAIFFDHATCRNLMTGCPATVGQFRACMNIDRCLRIGDPICDAVYACLPPGH